jgi:hypothetical protein
VLDVSPSGYYAWLKRPPSKHQQADLLLGDRIEALHCQSRGNYGRPRLQDDLRDEGIFVSDKRVARLDARTNDSRSQSPQGFSHDRARS